MPANCPNCEAPISDAWIIAERNRLLSTGVARRAKVLKPCPHCKKRFGARELRAHGPRCAKNPRNQE
jgi:hypothetical protein